MITIAFIWMIGFLVTLTMSTHKSRMQYKDLLFSAFWFIGAVWLIGGVVFFVFSGEWLKGKKDDK